MVGALSMHPAPTGTRPRTRPGANTAATSRRRVNLHASILRYLTEIARAGSIRRAAATLNVASSAVNRQGLRLQPELGVRGFDRLPTGMPPTPPGAPLLPPLRGAPADLHP